MHIEYKKAHIKFTQLVYEPSEDSFLLADASLSEIKDNDVVLEVGCGSGIVSAVVNANKNVTIIGIDINPYAAKCSKENGIEVIRGDLLSCIKGKFDVILFNPPYLPTEDNEKTNDWMNTALDGGYDGKKIIYRFLEDAKPYLSDNGKILMLVSSLTGIDEIKSKAYALNFSVKDVAYEHYMFEKLLVISIESM